ncbi:LysR substrate-binding domain-containing protein [Pseudomonas qingdaonensis]|nr:LysR substrate-binding domain-containing protein [Pseudomonas qingdaonensis]
MAQRYLDEQLITPQLLCELDALETIVMLVAQGMGVSLVPQWAGMPHEGICAWPLGDDPRHARALVVLHGSTPRRPVAMRHLLGLLGSPSPVKAAR